MNWGRAAHCEFYLNKKRLLDLQEFLTVSQHFRSFFSILYNFYLKKNILYNTILLWVIPFMNRGRAAHQKI